MTLLEHPLWSELLPHLKVLGAQSRGLNGARHRLEVRNSAPAHLFNIEVTCASCGRPMHPVRARRGVAASWFLSVTCPLEVSVACARQATARVAAAEIREAIEAYQR